MKRIWGVKCVRCKERMFSLHVHDYKLCGCSNKTMVDGGRVYLRYGWKTLKPTRIYWSKQDGNYLMRNAPIKKIKTGWPY